MLVSMRRLRTFGVILAILAVAAPAAMPAPAGRPEKPNLKIALAVPTASHLPIYVAQHRGFFKEEGLNVELVVFRAAPEALSVYLAGGVDFANMGITEVFTAREAGKNLKAVWMVSNAMPYELWARPNIKSLKDAKGARFAISRYGAFSDFITRWALRKGGLDPEKDARILQVGGPGERLAALVRGAVDVAILEPAEGLQAKKAGMVLMTRVYDYLPQFPAQPYVSTPEWITRNPETARAIIRATRKAIKHLRANKADAIAIYKQVLRYEDDVAELAYNFYVPAIPYNGAVPLRGLQVALEDALAAKRIKRMYTFEEIVDTRLINEFANQP